MIGAKEDLFVIDFLFYLTSSVCYLTEIVLNFHKFCIFLSLYNVSFESALVLTYSIKSVDIENIKRPEPGHDTQNRQLQPEASRLYKSMLKYT